MPLCGRQIVAARGLLGWNQKDLQNATGLAISTIRGVEKSDGNYGQANTWRTIQAKMEDAGVIFIDADPVSGKGAGVRLRRSESQFDT